LCHFNCGFLSQPCPFNCGSLLNCVFPSQQRPFNCVFSFTIASFWSRLPLTVVFLSFFPSQTLSSRPLNSSCCVWNLYSSVIGESLFGSLVIPLFKKKL
jgi:hypothetical protein